MSNVNTFAYYIILTYTAAAPPTHRVGRRRKFLKYFVTIVRVQFEMSVAAGAYSCFLRKKNMR